MNRTDCRLPIADCRSGGGPALAGFTLIELIAALSIFLVVVTASYALFEGGRKLAARGELHAKRFQAARAGFRALETDLRTVFAGGTYDTGFVGKSGGTTDLPTDTLDIVGFNNQPRLATPVTATTAEPPPKEIDITRVAYSIDDDSSTIPSGLVRLRTRLVAEVVTVKDPTEGLEEVSADVVGLKFRYYDGTAWTETWDSVTGGTVPKAVEITLHVKSTYRDQQEIEIFSTKIFLPIAATAPPRSP